MTDRQQHFFDEMKWRIWGHGSHQPLPWWVQQHIRQVLRGLRALRAAVNIMQAIGWCVVSLS